MAEVRVECVPGSYFSVLGAGPRLGVGFPDDAQDATTERIALLSEGFWRRNHGGEASVIGSALQFGGQRFRIVGVMPAGFRGVEPTPVDVRIPLASASPLCSFSGEDLRESTGGAWLQTVGRLRDPKRRWLSALERTRTLVAALPPRRGRLPVRGPRPPSGHTESRAPPTPLADPPPGTRPRRLAFRLALPRRASSSVARVRRPM